MKLKKLLGFVLALAMVLSLMPAAFAADTYVAKIGENTYATFTEALTAANGITGDVTVEIYGKVEYAAATPNLTGNYDSISFVGKTTDAEISITRDGPGGYISGNGNDCTVNFTDLILSKPTGAYAYDAGFMNVYFTVYRVGAVNYTNCTFPDGACAQGCAVTYTDCDFANQTSGEYSLWVYANCDVTVIDSEFTGVRGVKMYGEGAAKTGNLDMSGTTFTASVTQKPAIVLTYGESVTLDGNTYPAKGVFELDLGGDPNGTTVTSADDITCVNGNGDCGVLVTEADGTTKIYTTVAKAAEAAEYGDTVTLLHNTNETVELAAGVTVEKNGYTAENVTVDEGETHSVATADELKNALSAAQPGDTVTLTGDITVDGQWASCSVPAGVTIDGAGYTLKVGSVGHYGANAVFYSSGSYTVKNITIDVENGGTAAALDMGDGGVMENVTVNGSFLYALIYESDVTITNSTVSDETTYGVYANDGSSPENVTISGNTFNCLRGGILRGSEVFTDNTVNGDKGITVAGTGCVVTGNTFTGDRALDLYTDGEKIEKNQILGNIEVESGVTADLTGNYWGGSEPANLPEGVTSEWYYKAPTMNETDRSDYVAPVTGPTLYTITKAACENGKVIAQAVMASAGSTIKVSAEPAEGYKLVALVVTDAAGNEIEVVDGKIKMPASNITVSATFVYDLPFTDVADDNEHYNAIAYMYVNGLMIGTSEDEYVFSGEMTMTRAQIAQILYRLAGEPAAEYAGTFTDAPEGEWYTAAAEWAHASGIVVGTSEDTFTPGREITVNELATLVYRYAQCQQTGSCTSTEDDWTVEFAAAMTWCVENGVLTEDASASDIADRYLAADMFYNVYNLLNK